MSVDHSSTLPAIPGVIARDSVPGRLSLRVIETALAHGWGDDAAARAAERGRAAMLGLRWRSRSDTDAVLHRHRHRAVAWLAQHATPHGHELVSYPDVIVLVERSAVR